MAGMIKSKEKISGKTIIELEVDKLRAHQNGLMDFLYVMQENHAKQLEIYSDMFENISAVNIDQEWLKTMKMVQQYADKDNELQDFLRTKNNLRGRGILAG